MDETHSPVYYDGLFSQQRGIPQSENPYPRWSTDFEEWDSGWIAGDEWPE